jgi:hypothetical protein
MPTKAILHWSLGMAYHLLNQANIAQKEWKLANELDPKFNGILNSIPEMKKMNAILKGKQK